MQRNINKFFSVAVSAGYVPHEDLWGKTQHSLVSVNLLSSSSSSAGGRAEGISWISRRVCSVVWRFPSWCSCWLTQEEVKPPSSWDRLEGVGEDTAVNKRTDVRKQSKRAAWKPLSGTSSRSWASAWGGAAFVEFLSGLSVSAMLTSHTIVAGEQH